MNVRIISLSLENFRAAKRFVLMVDGHNACVFGRNKAGKSTLADAWAWLLTGKTADGRGDAEIKTTGPDGKAIPNLDHSVTAELEVDGMPLVLRRCMREKWTKKRGSQTPEFAGHETVYEVDGVPVNERTFSEKIASLAPANLLPVLSNPSYFPLTMHWKDRRALLLQVAGDLTEEQVIAGNPHLAALQEVLKGKRVEDFKAIQVAAAKKINAELLTLPARVDEASRQSVTDEDMDALSVGITAAQDDVHACQQAEVEAENGGGVAAIRVQLREAKAQVDGFAAAETQRMSEATAEARREQARAKQNLAEAELLVRRYEREVASLQDGLKNADAAIQAKREEWDREVSSEIEIGDDRTCPTCGQKLGVKATKMANEKAQEDFNVRKAEILMAIERDAAVLKRGRERVQGDLDVAVQKLDDARAKHAFAAKHVADASAALLKAESSIVVDVSGVKTLEEEVAKLEEQLSDAARINAEAVAKAKRLTTEAQAALSSLMTRRAMAEAAEQAKVRVIELEQKQRELGREYERTQELIFLCDKFVTTKVDMLEDRVSAKFGHGISFRMYETLINGGVSECADVMHQETPGGRKVPFLELNDAAKVQVGLLISAVIGKHFGVSLPVFVDSRESVTELPEVPMQTISLMVDPDAPGLEVLLDPTVERMAERRVKKAESSPRNRASKTVEVVV